MWLAFKLRTWSTLGQRGIGPGFSSMRPSHGGTGNSWGFMPAFFEDAATRRLPLLHALRVIPSPPFHSEREDFTTPKSDRRESLQKQAFGVEPKRLICKLTATRGGP
jgi:hypothetical protein